MATARFGIPTKRTELGVWHPRAVVPHNVRGRGLDRGGPGGRVAVRENRLVEGDRAPRPVVGVAVLLVLCCGVATASPMTTRRSAGWSCSATARRRAWPAGLQRVMIDDPRLQKCCNHSHPVPRWSIRTANGWRRSRPSSTRTRRKSRSSCSAPMTASTCETTTANTSISAPTKWRAAYAKRVDRILTGCRAPGSRSSGAGQPDCAQPRLLGRISQLHHTTSYADQVAHFRRPSTCRCGRDRRQSGPVHCLRPRSQRRHRAAAQTTTASISPRRL